VKVTTGREFAHDIRKAGVGFDTPCARDGAADGALSDFRHAGRQAHDEHFSGRLSGAWA